MQIGRASCELRIEASHQGEMRMRLKQVLVFISADTGRALSIPPELKSRMQRFRVDAGADGAAATKPRKPRARARPGG